MKYIKQKLLFIKKPPRTLWSQCHIMSPSSLKCSTGINSVQQSKIRDLPTSPRISPRDQSWQPSIFHHWRHCKVHYKEICILLKNTSHTCRVQNHRMRGWGSQSTSQSRRKKGYTIKNLLCFSPNVALIAG